jgi:hypothetical protein
MPIEMVKYMVSYVVRNIVGEFTIINFIQLFYLFVVDSLLPTDLNL